MIFCSSKFTLALVLALHAFFAADANEPNYYFNKAPFIPPSIVQDLSTWLSDGGDQVVAINLSDSVNSNRYSSEIKADGSGKGNPYVFTKDCTHEPCSEFGYVLIGKTTSGLFVLSTEDSGGGGSGRFRNLMLVSLERDHGLTYDERKNVLRPERERWLIKKWGEVPLGDRYVGNVTVSGNTIHIEKDHGGSTGVVDKDKTIRLELTH
jgi:hypothetical protein